MRSAITKFAAISSLLVLTGCATGERMVRIVETGAGGLGAEVQGVRIETTAEPLQGSVWIRYTGEQSVIEYRTGIIHIPVPVVIEEEVGI